MLQKKQLQTNLAKAKYLILTSFFLQVQKNHHNGIKITDKLSTLPFSNAVFTMHSANEDEGEHELESCIRSHTSCGVMLSKIPSEETTKNLSLPSRVCQPVIHNISVFLNGLQS